MDPPVVGRDLLGFLRSHAESGNIAQLRVVQDEYPQSQTWASLDSSTDSKVGRPMRLWGFCNRRPGTRKDDFLQLPITMFSPFFITCIFLSITIAKLFVTITMTIIVLLQLRVGGGAFLMVNF